MSFLAHVPDAIQAAAKKAGIVADVPGSPVGSATFMSAPLQAAYARGDYNTVQDFQNRTANDLNPIYSNINQREKAAFFQVINASNNTPYYLSISGPPHAPTGYMWIYTAPPPPSETSVEGGPTPQPVVQMGSLSMSGNTLGISNSLWTSTPAEAIPAIISLIVTTIVGKYIKKRIAGIAVDAAVPEAAAEGGAEIVATGVVEASVMAQIGAAIGPVIVGAVAGAIVFFLIMFIMDFVWRTYKLAINIYNWDSNDWVINSWYGDNAKIDGDTGFSPVILPAATNWVTLPDGMQVQVPGGIASYATLVFDNKNHILEGLGVGINVNEPGGTGAFQLKYTVHRFIDNTIGLNSGMVDVNEYYDDPKTWQPDGTMSTKISFNTMTISSTTPELGGASEQLYTYDVNIGLPPSSGDAPQGKPPTAIKPRVPVVVMPKVKDSVVMPDGKKIAVHAVFKSDVVGKPVEMLPPTKEEAAA